MNPDSRRSTAPAPLLWLPLILVAAALVLRWFKLETPGMNLLPNFSPWMALAFTGTLLFPRTLPWWSWPLLLLGVDSLAMGRDLWTFKTGTVEIFTPYALYAAAAWLAARWRGRAGILKTLLGVTLCAVVFHLVTNTLSWWAMPEYSKSLSGWLQALSTGLPGYPPTWTFFRSTLLSDLGFSALLLAAFSTEVRVRRALGQPAVAA